MSIVVENPKSVQELMKLVGKPVVLSNFLYGILAINEKTNEVAIVTPGQPDYFAIEVAEASVIEEITPHNAIAKWRLNESFDTISTWYNHVDWSRYKTAEGWIKHYNDVVRAGELLKNDYTVNNGLKFL